MKMQSKTILKNSRIFKRKKSFFTNGKSTVSEKLTQVQDLWGLLLIHAHLLVGVLQDRNKTDQNLKEMTNIFNVTGYFSPVLSKRHSFIVIYISR